MKVRSSNLSRRFIFRRTFPTFRLDKKYLPRHSTRISTFHSISPVNDSKPLSRFIQTNEVSPRLIRFPSVDPRISGIMSAFEQLPAGYFFTRSITMTRLFTPRLEALHGWIYYAFPVGPEISHGTSCCPDSCLSGASSASTGYLRQSNGQRSSLATGAACGNTGCASCTR